MPASCSKGPSLGNLGVAMAGVMLQKNKGPDYKPLNFPVTILWRCYLSLTFTVFESAEVSVPVEA